MFSSLRSRLWLSYALITLAALSIVSLASFIYLVQNPLVYRQATVRLGLVEAGFIKRQSEWISLPSGEMQASLEKSAQTYDVRLLIFNPDRQVLVDTQTGQASLATPRFPRLKATGVMRDNSGTSWIYAIHRLDNGTWLMAAVLRPKVPLLTIVRDELFMPLVVGGTIALVLSLLLAYWLARWIGDPLQTVVVASRQMPSTEAKPLVARGPREVQALTRAFNEMNSRVQSSRRSQRDFVAKVSHELKTPLTSVQGFAQAILDGTACTPEAQKQAAQVIYDESGRMHRMVLDLLDLARLDAGTLDLQRTPVNLPALLNSVVEKFTPQARAANVDIRVEAAALPPVTGDGDRLAQVFTNLVDNALKYAPAGGSITLRAAQSGSDVQVDMADSGAGIPAEAQAHIFDRFFQADPSRPGGVKHGTGLGLAIVKEIVQAHGGTISVRSAAGQGSTFTVRLPLVLPTATTVVKRKN
jgi:signal transduction histidine kinase